MSWPCAGYQVHARCVTRQRTFVTVTTFTRGVAREALKRRPACYIEKRHGGPAKFLTAPYQGNDPEEVVAQKGTAAIGLPEDRTA